MVKGFSRRKCEVCGRKAEVTIKGHYFADTKGQEKEVGLCGACYKLYLEMGGKDDGTELFN
jgi:hypothetical protein